MACWISCSSALRRGRGFCWHNPALWQRGARPSRIRRLFRRWRGVRSRCARLWHACCLPAYGLIGTCSRLGWVINAVSFPVVPFTRRRRFACTARFVAAYWRRCGSASAIPGTREVLILFPGRRSLRLPEVTSTRGAFAGDGPALVVGTYFAVWWVPCWRA